MIRLELYQHIMHPDTRREDALNMMMIAFADKNQTLYEEFWRELGAQGLTEDYKFEIIGYDLQRDPFCCLFLEVDDDAKGIYMKMWLSDRLVVDPIPKDIDCWKP